MQLIRLEQALQLSRNEVIEKSKAYLSGSMAATEAALRFDRQYVRAEGCVLYDVQGNEYLDFVGGYGSVSLGHNHPRLLDAVRRVEQYPKIMQTAMQHLPAALADNLARVTPGNLCRTFFCNSGAEAVEGALKLARAVTGRPKFVYCHGAFHGKTFGALSVMGRTKYREPFEPLLQPTAAIPYGDLAALEKELAGGNVAAFIVEPIQGEAGVIVPPPGFLAGARELCTKHGALLIADEVQTGLGRTGKMFACEWEDVVPDVLCLAKALGGGMVAAGAYVTLDQHWRKAYGSLDRAIMHSSTFGGYWGNAIACAVGITTLEIIQDEKLIEQAREKGEYFLARLRALKEKYQVIKDVRGRGLLIGLELSDKGTGLVNKLSFGVLDKLAEEYMATLLAVELINRHRIATVYTLNNPSVIRLEPPLTVTKEQIDRTVDAIEDVLSRSKSFLGLAAKGLGAVFSRR
ncbi:aspartate aminotransferase family protein [Desulforudis sp. 1088]|uniref:aspartate aminotransferase family protein n=2 Tax=Candidatus Desulforudis TaxID=471826 RepID=UPI003CE45836